MTDDRKKYIAYLKYKINCLKEEIELNNKSIDRFTELLNEVLKNVE